MATPFPPIPHAAHRRHALAQPPRRRPPSLVPRLSLYAAAVAAALTGAGIAYWLNAQAPAAPLAAVDVAPVQPAAVVPPALVTALPPAAAAQAAATADTPPWLRRPAPDTPLLTVAELQELKATLDAAPDPGGTFARITAQMLFADAAQRFLQLQAEGGDAAERRALARLLEPALDAHVQRGESSASELRPFKAQLVAELHADPAARQAAMARWLSAHQLR
jgi:hypothetical protein